MKVPDRICVAPHQIFDYDLEIQQVGHNGAEEYIRKDALLEWLEVLKAQSLELREKGYGDVFYGAHIAILEEVINKLNKM